MNAILIAAVALLLMVVAWLLVYKAKHPHTKEDLVKARRDSTPAPTSPSTRFAAPGPGHERALASFVRVVNASRVRGRRPSGCFR